MQLNEPQISITILLNLDVKKNDGQCVGLWLTECMQEMVKEVIQEQHLLVFDACECENRDRLRRASKSTESHGYLSINIGE